MTLPMVQCSRCLIALPWNRARYSPFGRGLLCVRCYEQETR